MSVPAGYKTTEAGVIPEDWDAVPLGSMFTFKNGLNKAKQFFGHGTPIVNYMDVFRHPALRMTKVAGRVEVNKSELDSYSVRQGDVFFTRTSETIEEVGIASTMLDVAESTVFSGFVLRARPKGDDLVDQFKAYAFRSEAVRNQIIAKATYTTRALTNGGTLSAIYLAKPTKPEQSAIAEALSDMDEAIAAQEAVVAKKGSLKAATMQALLSGTRRLPGFSGEWDVKTLGQIGHPHIGLTYSPRDVRETGTLVLRSSNVQAGALAFEDNVFVDPIVAQNCLVEENDILICVRNGSRDLIGKCAKIDMRAKGMAFGAFMSIFRTNDHGYIFHQMQSDSMRRQIHEHLGATINQITNSSLNAFRVPWPWDKKERESIAEVLSEMDEEIAASEVLLAKLHQLKVGMMQQLLTGKIRLV